MSIGRCQEIIAVPQTTGYYAAVNCMEVHSVLTWKSLQQIIMAEMLTAEQFAECCPEIDKSVEYTFVFASVCTEVAWKSKPATSGGYL